MPRRKRSIVSGYSACKVRDRKLKKRSECEEKNRMQDQDTEGESSHNSLDVSTELHGESLDELIGVSSGLQEERQNEESTDVESGMDVASGPQGGESSGVRNGLQRESSVELTDFATGLDRESSDVSKGFQEEFSGIETGQQGETSHELMDGGCSQNM